MVAVAVVMIALQVFVKGNRVENFYKIWLKGAMELLNRHMSVGFVVPLAIIPKGPMPGSREIGLIIGAFVVTGISNSILVYVGARGVQTLTGPCFPSNRCMRITPSNNPASIVEPNILERQRSFTRHLEEHDAHHLRTEAAVRKTQSLHLDNSDAETVVTPEVERASETIEAKRKHRVVEAFTAEPVLFVSSLLFVAVGIPIAGTTGHTTLMDTFILITFWTGTLAAQASARKNHHLQNSPRLRAVITSVLNAVLLTCVGMVGYMYTLAALKHVSLAFVLDSFQTNNTVADLIHQPSQHGTQGTDDTSQPFTTSNFGSYTIGAGDLAISLLNAGIVSWGFKLFDCRKQLLSAAGCTTMVIGTTAALMNAVCWPLLAHAMTLAPASRALAFAARNVTIALAAPALETLGGDVGLNAAMVVFNGLIFQIGMGLGVDKCIIGVVKRLARRWEGRRSRRQDIEKGPGRHTPGLETDTDTVFASDDRPLSPASTSHKASHDPHTVATGITVGINAAAMGTATLNEQHSPAASFSALSMTIYGAMTVAFTASPPLAAWLQDQVA